MMETEGMGKGAETQTDTGGKKVVIPLSTLFKEVNLIKIVVVKMLRAR